MRIAELARCISRLDGGIFFALAGLLPRVARTSGIDVRAFGAADPYTGDDRRQLLPMTVEAYRSWPPSSFGYSPGLLPALRRFAPDIVHVHGLWAYPSLASLQFHRRCGAPLIVSPHGMLDAWALARSRGRKSLAGCWFQNAQLRAATVLHALTEAEARAFRKRGLEQPIAVIPNGVDLPAAAPPPSLRLAASPGRPRTLLFLGRLHPKKGLDPLIDAWVAFARSETGRSWRLVVAGWDELGFEAELRARASAGGAAGAVVFAGPLWGEQKQAAYAAADAFILPSFSEGLPMAVLEAWAYAKPAIISAACNLPEGAAAGAAFTAAPTVDGIGEALLRMSRLAGPELHAMGMCGRRLVEQRFTWTKLSSDVVRLYQAVAAREPPPQDLLFSDR